MLLSSLQIFISDPDLASSRSSVAEQPSASASSKIAGPIQVGSGSVTVNISVPCGYLNFEPSAELWLLLRSRVGESFSTSSSQPALATSTTLHRTFGTPLLSLLQDCRNPDESAPSVVANTALLTASDSPYGYKSVTFSGSLDLVNAAVGSLTYSAPAAFVGLVNLFVNVSDNGNVGSGNTLFATASVPISITQKNMAPVVNCTHELSLPEHSLFRGSDIFNSFSDADGRPTDAYTMTITATLSHYPLSLASISDRDKGSQPITFSVPLQFDSIVQNSISIQGNAASLQLVGLQADVTSAFSDTVITLPFYYHGVVKFTIVVTDVGGIDSDPRLASSWVYIRAINDPPVIYTAGNASFLRLSEDAAVPLGVTIDEPDVHFLTHHLGHARLNSDTCCPVSVNVSCANCFFFQDAARLKHSKQVMLLGSLQSINTSLAAMLVQGDADISGNSSAHVKITMSDLGNFGAGALNTSQSPLVVSKTITLHIDPVNDPPKISVPAFISTVKETPISPANITCAANVCSQSIIVTDVDSSPGDALTLLVGCVQGSVSVIPNPSVVAAFDAGGVAASKQIVVRANIRMINLVLQGLLYTPNRTHSGTDHVNFTVVDAYGGVGSSVLPVLVTATNSRPTLVTDPSFNLSTLVTYENTDYLWPLTVTVHDDDIDEDADPAAASPLLQATVTASHGGMLEVQEVTTSAVHVDEVQTVATTAFNTNTAIASGSFTVSVDLRAFGCGVATTSNILFDAVGATSDEKRGSGGSINGYSTGQSFESKLAALIPLQTCGVTVTVSRQGNSFFDTGSIPGSSGNDLFKRDADSRTNAYAWRVTFHNASFAMPLLTIASQSFTPATTTITISRTSPGTAISGTFRLWMGQIASPPIPANASADELAVALETMDMVQAVHVTRNTLADLQGGFTWTITFFAVNASETGDVPQLQGDPSGLSGSVSINTPTSPNRETLPVHVDVRTVQQGVGNPRVFQVSSSASHVNETIVISLYSNGTNQFANTLTEYFTIKVTDPLTGSTGLVGPIYRSTVPMMSQEQANSALIITGTNAALGTKGGRVQGAQKDGTGVGESIQSMFRSLPFFSTFADDVDVSFVQYTVQPGRPDQWGRSGFKFARVVMSWRVTFVHASYNSFSYAVGPSKLLQGPTPSYAMVQIATPPNTLGGSFQLSYAGHPTLDKIPYDVSADALCASLMDVPTVHDPQLDLGRVQCSRRGPDNHRAYRWLVAFVQDPEITASLVSVERNSAGYLTGLGAAVGSSLLRQGATTYAVRIGAAYTSGLFNISSQSLASLTPMSLTSAASGSSSFAQWQKSLVMLGTPRTLSTALSHLQYRPADNWCGLMTVVLRVTDSGFYGTDHAPLDASLAVHVRVLAVNDAPVLLWRNQPLTNSSFVELYEDAEVTLGNEFLYDDIDQGRLYDTVTNNVLISQNEKDPSIFVYHNLIGSASGIDLHRHNPVVGIQVRDVDAGSGLMTVSLYCERGFLSMKSSVPIRGDVSHVIMDVRRVPLPLPWRTNMSALHDVKTQVPNQTLTVQGNVDEVNAWLKTLRYQSYLNSHGYDRIHVTAWDNGNTAENAATAVNMSCYGYLLVRINPVNDAPVITINGTALGSFYYNSSTWQAGVIQSFEDIPIPVGTYFQITDADMNISNINGAVDWSDWKADRNAFADYSLTNSDFFVTLDVVYGRINFPYLGDVHALGNDLVNVSKTVGVHFTVSTARDVSGSSVLRTLYGSGLGYRHIEIRGNYHDVIATVASAVYTPDANWFGIDVLEIFVSDLGNIGDFGEKHQHRKIILDVQGVPDQPIVNLPTAGSEHSDMLVTVEDTVGVIGSDPFGWVPGDYGAFGTGHSISNISFASIFISDLDLLTRRSEGRYETRNTTTYNNVVLQEKYNATYADVSLTDSLSLVYYWNRHVPEDANITVTLRTHHGVMTMVRVPESLQFLHGSGFQDDLIIVHGSLLDVNIALQGLNYVPDQNWNSFHNAEYSPLSSNDRSINNLELLEVSVNDTSGLTDYKQINIFVKPANDPPVLTVGPLSVHDHTQLLWDQMSPKRIAIQPLICQENSPCPLAELMVRDVDAAESAAGVLQVTLSAYNGSFSVDVSKSTISYYFDSAHVNQHSVMGSVVQMLVPAQSIDTALEGILYSPFVDFYGTDMVTISVDDLGNTGYGPLCIGLEVLGNPCRLTDSVLLPVQVHRKADRLEITNPTYSPQYDGVSGSFSFSQVVLGQEDSDVMINGLRIINHEDFRRSSLHSSVDGAAGNADGALSRWMLPGLNSFALFTDLQYAAQNRHKHFQAELVTGDGSISLNTTAGLDFVIGDGFRDSHMIFSGGLGDLNRALSTLVFLPTKNFHSFGEGHNLAKVTLIATDVDSTLRDSATTFSGPATSTTGSTFPLDAGSARAEILISVSPRHDPPSLRVPGEQISNLERDKHWSRQNNTVEDPFNFLVTGVDPVFIDEDESYPLAGAFIEDVDSDLYASRALSSLMLSCDHGTIYSDNVTIAFLLETVTEQVETMTPWPSKSYNPTSFKPNASMSPAVTSQVYYRVQGDVETLNEVLTGLQYRPSADFNGADSIYLSVCNSGETVITAQGLLNTQTPVCSSKVIPVIVVPVNDQPVWLVPTDPQVVGEDTTLRFQGAHAIQLYDADAGNQTLFVQIIVDFGVMTIFELPNSITLLVGTGDNDREIQFSGSLVAINVVLGSLGYTPPLNWNSAASGLPDQIRFLVDDAVDTTTGLTLTATADMALIVVQGENHKPTVEVPGATYNSFPCESQGGAIGQVYAAHTHHQCRRIVAVALFNVLEDIPTILAGVTVSDPDQDTNLFASGQLTLNVSAKVGFVSLPDVVRYGVQVVEGRARGDPAITVLASVEQLNLVLKTLTYIPPAEYYGQDFVSVYVNDNGYSGTGGAKWVNETIPILVIAQNDAPVFSTPENVQDVLEDGRLSWVGINVTDADFVEFPEGLPTYSLDNGDAQYPFVKTAQWNETMTRKQQFGRLRVSIHSEHGRVMLATTVGLNVLTVPDVNAESTRLGEYPSLSLDASGGRETFVGANAEKPHAVSSGNPKNLWWKSVTFEGRLFDINRALSVVVYWPDNNWNSGVAAGDRGFSVDLVNFTVVDEVDATLSSSKLVAIRVHAANDAPVLTIPGSVFDAFLLTEDRLQNKVTAVNTMVAREDQSLAITGIEVRDVDADMAGVYDSYVRISLTAINGSVSVDFSDPLLALPTTSSGHGNIGIVLEEGSGISDVRLVFRASLLVANRALSTVVFTPSKDFFGRKAGLRVRVDDLGQFGAGGSKFDEQLIPITVEPVNDPVVVQIPADFEGERTFFLDEGDFIRVQGAKYFPVLSAMNLSRNWQAGYELWRFDEPQRLAFSTKSTSYHNSNKVREYPNTGNKASNEMIPWGPGQLNWDSRQAADINIGPLPSHPRFLKEYKGDLYFQADDGLHGPELWRVQSLTTGSSISGDIEAHIDVEPGVHGRVESTDGRSPALPVLFQDMMPGAEGSGPSHMQVHTSSQGQFLYFAADGVDLSWMVLPSHRDRCGSFRQSGYDARIHFAVSEANVWYPSKVYDCPAGFHWATTQEGFSYFTSSYEHPFQHMWHSESGSEVGERHGKQDAWHAIGTDPASTGEWETATSVDHAHELKTYYNDCGWDGYVWGGKSRKHFRFSDSVATGAFKHSGKYDSYTVEIDSLERTGQLWTQEFAGIVCVSGSSPSSSSVYCNSGSCMSRAGSELWRTDGTAEGTLRLEDINSGPASSSPAYLTSFDGQLYFAATSMVDGRELWRSTGESGQAVLVSLEAQGLYPTQPKGINPGFESSNPEDLTVSGSQMFFAATELHTGRELWVTRTMASPQTYLEPIDIVPGTASSNPSGFVAGVTISGAHVVYFQAYSAIAGVELYVSDGTRAGTTMVKDIFPGTRSSSPSYLTWFLGKVYFQADDGVFGKELWCSDGTAVGTTLLRDIRGGLGDSSPSFLTVMTSALNKQSYLMFSASDGEFVRGINNVEGFGGSQIWRTDGTYTGTSRAFMRTGNDVYVDRASLDLAHPSAFTVFKNGLYLSGNVGVQNVIIPKGGFLADNEEASVIGIDQALVVADVDTPPTGNISVILSVSAGFLVLDDKTSTTPWSKNNNNGSLRVLVVESDALFTNLFLNSFSASGHTVDMATKGQEALDLIVSASTKGFLYDIVVMDLDLTMSQSWDGVQTARAIRVWEEQQRTMIPSLDALTIVGVSPLRSYVGSELLVQEISKIPDQVKPFDLYLPLPPTRYAENLPVINLEYRDTSVGTSPGIVSFKTSLMAQDEWQQSDFDALVATMEKFIFRTSRDVNITVITPAQDAQLATMPKDLKNKFLAGTSTVGVAISIEGTIIEVNVALRALYFNAPIGTNGNITLTVTATDRPLGCNNASLLVYSIEPKSLDNFNTTDDGEMCDIDQPKTTNAYIFFFVSPINQAPELSLSAKSIIAHLDTQTSLPTIIISDVDISETAYTTSFGISKFAPVSLVVSTRSGRLSLPVREDLAFLQGSGRFDRRISMRGSLDVVNNALSQMLYICKSSDSLCVTGYKDELTISVNDEGFTGRGGPLTATASISITIG